MATTLGAVAVGSSVYMNINGVRTEFLVVHQGLPSSLYDGSCDGTWLLMKNVYETRQWHNSNSNSYKASTIHTYLNGTFLNLFDADIKAQIKTVKIPYVNGTGSSAVASGSSGLSAQIFLLSGYEVGWTQSTDQYFPIDGACLSYFSGTSATDSKRIAYLNGTATRWWLRSPYTGVTRSAWYVLASGNCSSDRCSGSYGVRPALVMPTEMGVDDSGNVTQPKPAATSLANIDDTNYPIAQGFVLVDSIEYPLIAHRVLVDDVMYEGAIGESGPSYSEILDENTPDMIAQAAIEGVAPDLWDVGDTIGIALNGTVGALTFSNETYYAFILGFDHNPTIEGYGTIHFQMAKTAAGVDIAFCDSLYGSYDTTSTNKFKMNTTNTNSGGWKSSTMRTARCAEFLTAMPTAWQNVIAACTKYSDNTGGGSDTASYVTATSDKIWLLSEFEVQGTRSDANSAEQNYQKQYDYYKNGNSKVKYKHNATTSACLWWLRSVRASRNDSFCTVYTGGSAGYSTARYSRGFTPGFVVGDAA